MDKQDESNSESWSNVVSLLLVWSSSSRSELIESSSSCISAVSPQRCGNVKFTNASMEPMESSSSLFFWPTAICKLNIFLRICCAISGSNPSGNWYNCGFSRISFNNLDGARSPTANDVSHATSSSSSVVTNTIISVVVPWGITTSSSSSSSSSTKPAYRSPIGSTELKLPVSSCRSFVVLPSILKEQSTLFFLLLFLVGSTFCLVRLFFLFLFVSLFRIFVDLWWWWWWLEVVVLLVRNNSSSSSSQEDSDISERTVRTLPFIEVPTCVTGNSSTTSSSSSTFASGVLPNDIHHADKGLLAFLLLLLFVTFVILIIIIHSFIHSKDLQSFQWKN